jgi:hypothetical protein
MKNSCEPTLSSVWVQRSSLNRGDRVNSHNLGYTLTVRHIERTSLPILALFHRKMDFPAPRKRRSNKSKGGSSRPQPRAEFRGNGKDQLYYNVPHGKYNEHGLAAHPNLRITENTPANLRPYAKRETPPLDIPRTGLVTMKDCHVVRQRNLPKLLFRQMSEVGQFNRFDPTIKVVCSTLFPNRSVYDSQDPRYRPQAYCIQTRFWTDTQVETWGKFAMAYGIQYSGRTEYLIPKALLGYISGGTVYASNLPWPRPQDPGPLQDLYVSPHRRKRLRSSQARVMRALRKVQKREFEVKPIPLEEVLVFRRQYSRKTIDRMFPGNMPISEYRRSVPNVLSLAFGPPGRVSPPAMEALRRIYSRPEKFVQDLPWLAPKGKTPSVRMAIERPVSQPVRERNGAKLYPVLHSDHGGCFRSMVGTGSHLYLVDTRKAFDKRLQDPAGRQKVIDNYHRWKDLLDGGHEPERSSGHVLGSWFD